MKNIQDLKKNVDKDVTMRNAQDLVKIRKPVVKRKGKTVDYCSFFKRTGQCFGSRCFWTKHGVCPFFNDEKDEEEDEE